MYEAYCIMIQRGCLCRGCLCRLDEAACVCQACQVGRCRAMRGPHLRSLAHFPLPPRAILLRASSEGSLVTVPLNISEGFLNCCCSLRSWPTAFYESCVLCAAFIGLARLPPFPCYWLLLSRSASWILGSFCAFFHVAWFCGS